MLCREGRRETYGYSESSEEVEVWEERAKDQVNEDQPGEAKEQAEKEAKEQAKKDTKDQSEKKKRRRVRRQSSGQATIIDTSSDPDV